MITTLAVTVLCGCSTSTPQPIPAPAPTRGLSTSVSAPEYDAETIDILVTGHFLADRKGIYHFRPDEPCTIMHLLFKMGGLPAHVDARDVQVIRRNPNGETEEFKVNAREILQSGEPEKDFPLKHGDRVVIQPELLAI